MRNGNLERGVPVFSRRGEGDGEADRPCQEIVPEFHGRHLLQAGLRPPVVVIVDVVADLRDHVGEGPASPKAQLVLRVAEEALHRGVVPAIPPPRHGLADAAVREVFPVFAGRVMASLVGMEEERAGKPIDRIELPEHIDDEGHVYRLGERPGDDLVGRRVLDRRKVAPLLAVRAVVKIAYVGEQVLSGPADGELPVQLVREQRVRPYRLRDPLQRIRPPYRAFQPVFAHEPLDFLPVHRRPTELWHQHRDLPRSLRSALEIVDGLDDEEIGVVPRLPRIAQTVPLPGLVSVVPGSGDAQFGAHPGDVEPEPIRVFLLGPVDYLEPFLDGDFDGW